MDIIRSRQLLPCPDLCPPRMYSLMVECWAELPHRRPTFEELHTRLKQWLLPLLGPNSNFSPHIHIHPNLYATTNCNNSNNSNSSSHSHSNPNYPFAPPSCASNNSMSSHQSSNTGPLSNNTNSTSVSTQWPSRPLQTFQSPSNCVAYQSTPIVHCQMTNGSNGYSQPQYQNQSVATAHFHPNSGRVSHTHSPNGNPLHSPNPYRVFMESKSTNI